MLSPALTLRPAHPFNAFSVTPPSRECGMTAQSLAGRFVDYSAAKHQVV